VRYDPADVAAFIEARRRISTREPVAVSSERDGGDLESNIPL
jgi:hypothetical protein